MRDKIRFLSLGAKKIKAAKVVSAMVFNATFNNISPISWRSVLLVEETGGEGKSSAINDKHNHRKLYRFTSHHDRDSNSQLWWS